MTKKPLRILAVNPGTKYLGIAVHLGPELRDWRVKTIHGKWSKQKMKKIETIVLDFIDQYDPTIMAIKKLHPSRSSKNLEYLATKIKELSKNKGLKIYQYSTKEMENFFQLDEKTNKMKMAKTLASEYPYLFREFNREKSNKNTYHIRMFEAVALASVCFHQLDK